MDLGLEGRTAAVAAASGGLGFAIAKALITEGAQVSISSSNERRIGEAASSLAKETGGKVTYRACDVRDPAAVGDWLGEVAEREGGLDLVIPNAGGPRPGTFAELEDFDWEGAFRLTLLSAVRTARAAHTRMRPGGSLLFMTSSSVKEPIGHLVLSNVFRAGVAALAKTLATEWAEDGIRVNHLIPGRIATQRVETLDGAIAAAEGVSRDEVQARTAAAIPLGRYGEPDEFAAAAVFLVSPAASYITGSTLVVDGGALHAVM
jgi:3-oxoacyl-[acyl-carrier protein] reductase